MSEEKKETSGEEEPTPVPPAKELNAEATPFKPASMTRRKSKGRAPPPPLFPLPPPPPMFGFPTMMSPPFVPMPTPPLSQAALEDAKDKGTGASPSKGKNAVKTPTVDFASNRKLFVISVYGFAVGSKTVSGIAAALAKQQGFPLFCSATAAEWSTAHKNRPWEHQREVFTKLTAFIDSEGPHGSPTKVRRGMVLDLACRSIEEIVFIDQLLRSKGCPMNGAICVDMSEDVWAERMPTSTPEDLANTSSLGSASFAFPANDLQAKLVALRQLQKQFADFYGEMGIGHVVTGDGSEEDVANKIKGILPIAINTTPKDTPYPVLPDMPKAKYIADFNTYYHCVTHVMKALHQPRKANLPSATVLKHLTKAVVDEKISELSCAYEIRPNPHGRRGLLLLVDPVSGKGRKLYFITKGMKTVYQIPSEAWPGMQHSRVCILDVNAVHYEGKGTKLFVEDCLFWDKASMMAKPLRERLAPVLRVLSNEIRSTWWPPNCPGMHVALMSPCSVARGKDVLKAFPEGFSLVHASAPYTAYRSDTTYAWHSPDDLPCVLRIGDLQANGQFGLEAWIFDDATKSGTVKALPQSPNTIMADLVGNAGAGPGACVECCMWEIDGQCQWVVVHVTDRTMPDTWEQVAPIMSRINGNLFTEDDVVGVLEKIAEQAGVGVSGAMATLLHHANPDQVLYNIPTTEAVRRDTSSGSVCCKCNRVGEGRVIDSDRANVAVSFGVSVGAFACKSCWRSLGFALCEDCGAFAKGKNEKPSHKFYCYECWTTFERDEKKASSGSEKKTRRGKQNRNGSSPAEKQEKS